MNGLQITSLYAQGCKRTKELGVDDFLAKAVIDFANFTNADKRKLISVLKQLEPFLYYSNLAKENKIESPFDAKIVRAYWLGSDITKLTTSKETIRSMLGEKKFREEISGMKKEDIAFAVAPLLRKGFKIHHNFTVLGLLHSQPAENFVSALDQCRVGWGKIIGIKADKIKVDSQKLTGSISGLRIERATLELSSGFLDSAQIKYGNWVTHHLGSGREIITTETAKTLGKISREAIEFFNNKTNGAKKAT